MLDVRQRLEQHRIPVDPKRAHIELDRAAPFQLNPVESCNGQVKGIAILIHGLSDTAYSMRDIATHLSERCIVARSILLPGHGTRPGDMLVVNHTHWIDTVRHLTHQAAEEHETVILVGFSLGAVLATTVALDDDSPVDALVGISPAYHITTWQYARLAPLAENFSLWVDAGKSDDPQRFEALPTRGVTAFVRVLKKMHKRFRRVGSYDRPWLIVQSMDDNTIVHRTNRQYAQQRGKQLSILEFFSDQNITRRIPGVVRVSSVDDDFRVNGLTHLAVHYAPDNPHYGADGDYRHCGKVDGRGVAEAQRCARASEVHYADWDKLPGSDGPPTALSSFNPRFDAIKTSLDELLTKIDA